MRTRMRRTTVLLSGLALATAGTAVTATPAWAGTDSSIDLTRGSMKWKSYGDTLTVWDKLSDGYWVEGHIRRWVGGDIGWSEPRYVQAKSGSGTHESWTWNLVEGTGISIRLCYWKGVSYVWCTGWKGGGRA